MLTPDKMTDKLDLRVQFADAPMVIRMGTQDYDDRTNWPVQRHCNADYEVHILLGGSFTFDVDDQSFPVNAGDAVIIAPGCSHYPHDLSTDFERFTFSFMPAATSLQEKLLSHIRGFVFHTMPEETAQLCRKIIREIRENNPFQKEALSAMFTELLVQLLRAVQVELSQLNGGSLQTFVLRTAIIDRFFSPWPGTFGTEQELADLLHLSRRQLNRILMVNYGMGFRQKMLQSRMEYAGNLLTTTDKRAGEIGLQVGYTEESSFYKAFQSYYRMTPQQYRAKNRKKSQPGKEK